MCHVRHPLSSVRMTEGFANDVRLFPHASTFLRLLTTRWWSHKRELVLLMIREEKSALFFMAWNYLSTFFFFETYSHLYFALVADGGAIECSGSALSHLDTAGRKDLGAAFPSPLEDSLRQAATCKLHLHWGDNLKSVRCVLFFFNIKWEKLESERHLPHVFVSSPVGFEKSQNYIVKCYQ